jgi:hypothetical protein
MPVSKHHRSRQAPELKGDLHGIQGTSPAAPVDAYVGRWARADLTERQAITATPPPPEER